MIRTVAGKLVAREPSILTHHYDGHEILPSTIYALNIETIGTMVRSENFVDGKPMTQEV